VDGSIGGVLSSIAASHDDLAMRASLTRSSAATDTSFTQLLDESLRAHAANLGYELPIPPADERAGAGLEPADEIWDRVKLQSQAGAGGIADALMDSLSKAADHRWEQRRHREHGTTNLFDF
jgi:hypothetical protein